MQNSKTASPLRKGFDYQDHFALLIALEQHIKKNEFNLYLEHNKAGGIDDIVLVQSDNVFAYQVKHAQNDLDNYVVDDFIGRTEKRVNFKKYSDGYKELKRGYPHKKILCHLVSNRSVDSQISVLLKDGKFVDEFINDNKRKIAKELRNQLLATCSIEENEFREFLNSFKFELQFLPLEKLKEYITDTILGTKLGITNRAIYFDLLQIIKYYSEESSDPLTNKSLNELLQQAEKKYLLPQKFEVNNKTFISLDNFYSDLRKSICAINGDYIVITGLPGSGKSTSVSKFLDALKDGDNYDVVRYYCFVSVKENLQKKRLEAESLRVNILKQLNDKYHSLLERRYDYSERNFDEALNKIGEHFVQENRKLIISIDGLDHAEREKSILNNVLNALPNSIPDGIIIIISSQELSHWQPLLLKKARVENHIQMPLFTIEDTAQYFEKCEIKLSQIDLELAHSKSEGLPLYLNYLATSIKNLGIEKVDIESIPNAVDGDISTYYETLWDNFETAENINARHLCATLTLLDFEVHIDELIEFQDVVKSHEFDNIINKVNHLLRRNDGLIKVFHNSFEVFVLKKINEKQKKDILTQIWGKLTLEIGTNRWYKYVFDYSLRIENYDYIFANINKEFVDNSLQAIRPNDEIIANILIAIEAATITPNLVEISRLAILHFQTNERFQNLDSNLLANALLELNKREEMINHVCDLKNNQLYVNDFNALLLIKHLIENNEKELANELFDIFTINFNGTSIDKNTITLIGYCLGVFGTNVQRNIEFFFRNQFKQDPVTDSVDYYTPLFAPHFQAYIESAIQNRNKEFIDNLKSENLPFDNKVVRYFIIRALNKFNRKEELTKEINEYIQIYPEESNLELGVAGCNASLRIENIRKLTGKIIQPDFVFKPNAPDRKYETIFIQTYYLSIITCYESGVTHRNIRILLPENKTYWASILRFLFSAGTIIGKFYKNESVSFTEFEECINCLTNAKGTEGERIIELLDAVRKLLPLIFFELFNNITIELSSKIENIIEQLRKLRESVTWTVHYGFNESITDYSFEQRVWVELTNVNTLKYKLTPIIQDCYDTYLKSTTLKGGTRSSHLLNLAYLSAKTGNRTNATQWVKEGILSTNVYGYHKDVTLSYLIDVLKLLIHQFPHKAFERCANILDMVKWIPHQTDGRSTSGFPKEAFEIVLSINSNAALDVINHYFQYIGKWQAINCIEEYILSKSTGDFNYLSALCVLVEPGEYSSQFASCQKHIALQAKINHDTSKDWDTYLNKILSVNISPRLLLERKYSDDKNKKENKDEKKYQYNSKEYTIDELYSLCIVSFDKFIDVIREVKNIKTYFYEPDLIRRITGYYLDRIQNIETLEDYYKKIIEYGVDITIDVKHKFGEKAQTLGSLEYAIHIYEDAYFTRFEGGKEKLELLRKIYDYDEKRGKKVIVKKIQKEVSEHAYGGYDIPREIARILHKFGDYEGLNTVYDQYELHCLQLFGNLPEKNKFDWLRNYDDRQKDERYHIVSILLNELGTQQIVLGNRIVCEIVNLAQYDIDFVLPLIVEVLNNAVGIKKNRLLTIIYCLSQIKPANITTISENLVKVFQECYYSQKVILIETIRVAFRGKNIPADINDTIKAFENKITSKYRVKTYSPIYIEPSRTFKEFFENDLAFNFSDTVKNIIKVLGLEYANVLGLLENRLLVDGWDIEHAKEKRNDDWDGNVHPQGWPVIWIFTSFQNDVEKYFYSFIEEYLENKAIDDKTVECVNRILQNVDIECVINSPTIRPNDIKPLEVNDRNAWLSELDSIPNIIEKEFTEENWVTVFEDREQASDEEYNVPYRTQLRIRGTLLSQKLLTEEQIEEEGFWGELIYWYNKNENVTWKQAVNILQTKNGIIPSGVMSIPIISIKQNPNGYLMDEFVVFLSSLIIHKNNLIFNRTGLFQGEEQITRYDKWQSGYIVEDYSRQRLSHGMRLQVRRTFLEKLMTDFDMDFVEKVTEVRAYFPDIYSQKPLEEKNRMYFNRFHKKEN